MEEKVNFAVVGLFVLVLSAVLIAGILWFSSGASFRKEYSTYQIYMTESVSGLNLNAPVRYRGVEIGRVIHISLAPGNIEQVQLTVNIERGTPVKVDTVAVIQSLGLTGLTFVELTDGSRESAELQAEKNQPYPVIKTEPSLMNRLDTSVTTLLGNLNRSSENINALLDEENRHAIKQTLHDIQLLTRTLTKQQTAIESSLNNAAITMENTARLTAQLPQIAQRIKQSADAFEQMTKNLDAAAVSTQATMNSTQQFTDNTLPEVHQLVDELRDLTGTLQRFSNELEQNPAMLIHGKTDTKRGPGE